MEFLSIYQSLPLYAFTSFGSARPFWTIAAAVVVRWIYLLFGWIIFANAPRKKYFIVFWSFLLFFLIVPGYNLINGRGNGLTMMWIMGLIVYIMLSSSASSLSGENVFLVAGIFFVFPLMRLGLTLEAYDLLYIALLSVSLFFLLYGLQGRMVSVSGWVKSSITFIANYSFTLYLVHYMILELVLRWLGPGWKPMLVGFVLSNILAIAQYLLFERHYKQVGMWLKHKFSVRYETKT